MPPGNSGVSIGVNVNPQGAQRGLAGISQGLGKLSASAKNLFGSGSAQQLNTYNKHLNQLERNLDRVNQRLKTLQGTQSNLLQQQRQLQQGGGPGAQAQLGTIQKALQQNQRSLSFWQAKQAGGQAAVQVAKSQRPGVGGGGGGFAGWAAGQLTNMAGGLGGTIIKALGVGAILQGTAEVVAKGFLTAMEEQKGLADLYPRMHMGGDASKWSPKGYMNEVRYRSMPFGYSGVEGVQIENAISSGSNGKRSNLHNDAQAAMQMARMFGIDAGGQASMLAEGGKMGAFVPGQAKKFAEMLAKEISVTGLSPRAQEVQEATLTLMHRQLSTATTASPATAMAEQSILARTGLPGFQGAQGAGVLGNFQSAVTGATSDPQIAFLEAAARNMGVTGYYNMRRLRDQGPLGNPALFASYFQTARKLAPTPDAAKDIMSQVGGMSFNNSEALYNKTHGFRDLNAKNVMALVRSIKSARSVDQEAHNAMTLPGNQFRKGEATLSSLLGKGGTPMVQGIGTLVDKASTMIQKLMAIDQNTKSLAEGLFGKDAAHLQMGATATVPDGKGGFKQSWAEKHLVNPVTGAIVNGWNWLTDQGAYSKHPAAAGGGGFPVPPKGSRGPTAAQINEMRKRFGPQSPQLPGVGGVEPYMPGKGNIIKRGSADNEMHLHVHFDPHGAIHPHVKQAFIGMVGEALQHIQQQQVRGGLHHRYPRA